MNIKKKTKNEYAYAGGVWVRNFTKPDGLFIDINKLVKEEDRAVLISNESKNRTLGLANISDEKFSGKKVVIVSDGWQFAEKHNILDNLPQNVVILAVHRALAKWNIKRSINAYVVNNPYLECLNYLPKNYYPIVIASSRTNHEFLKQYKGNKFLYEPTPTGVFGYQQRCNWHIDDYRNAIVAAIGLAFRLGAERLALFCCDDVFADVRPGAEQLPNGLYQYPQQRLGHEIIDANLYWLKEVKVADFSSGLKFNSAEYIKDIREFFND